MQHVEKRALATCWQMIGFWIHYVDDTFAAVHQDEIDAFHDHVNEQKADIQFTTEIEENGYFLILFGKPRQQRTTNDSVQKTDAYRQATWQIIVQPDFTQSHDY